MASTLVPRACEADTPGMRLGAATVSEETTRRIEEWVAHTLDDRDAPSSNRDGGKDWLEDLSFLRRAPQGQAAGRTGGGAKAPTTSPGEWVRFRTTRKRGITVVRLVDQSLVKEADLEELAGDLLSLIAAGNHRIVLDFRVVERLASWVVGVVGEAHRRCAAADGGALKVCGLQPQVAAVFAIAGLDREIAIAPDEAAAIEGAWPERSAARPLPIAILTAMTRAAELEPEPSGPEDGTPCGTVGTPGLDRSEASSLPVEGLPAMSEVWLIPQVGRSHGRSIPVAGPRFLIGRDPGCQLRPGSPAVSRVHAVIEPREGKIVVRDLGSTNGTIHNGRCLRNEVVEARDGDTIQVGPLVFTLSVGRSRPASGGAEESVPDRGPSEIFDAPLPETFEPTTIEHLPDGGGEAGGSALVRSEVIEGVLVITPLVSDLGSDATVEQIRAEFLALFEQPLPRRVVVNLEYVGHLAGQAIGLLVAHHLRVDRAGGAVRLCQAHVRVMAVLEQVRLPVLIPCYPTLDEAVLSAWPQPVAPV